MELTTTTEDDMPSYAIKVQVITEETLFVKSDTPLDAVEKVISEEGWKDATRYSDQIDLYNMGFDPKTMTVTQVKEMEE
jgi:hypothetical protein